MARSLRPPENPLLDCLHLCAFPIGSSERAHLLKELMGKWSAKVIWGTIEDHPQLFEWGVSIQGARLTGEGRRALEALR